MTATLRNIHLQIVIDVKNLPALRTLSSSLQSVQGSTQGATRAFQGQTNNALHPLAAAYRDLTDNLTRTEKAMDAVWRAASHYEQVGRRLIDVARQIVDLGMNIVSTYADYDYWLRRAGVALNTNVVWQQRLDDAIQGTAKAVGLFSPEEAAEAYNIWGAATGVVVDNQKTLAAVTATVEKIMIATAGAGGTLETNLKGVSGILGIFNLGIEDAGRVTEVLALMTERTQADFGDLISAFTYIGPQARSMGIEFDDVAQMLGVLADAGQRGSRAGRGLSMMIEGLLAPTDAITAKLSELTLRTKGVGKTWEEIAFPNDKFAGLDSIVRDLSKTYMGMTDSEKAWFNARAASNNAIRALLPLVNSTIDLWNRDADAMARGQVAVDKQKYSLENAGAFFENMKVQMLGSIKAIVGSFKNSFFPILQMVALKIMELAQPVMNVILVALDKLTEYLKDNPAFVDFIVKMAAMTAGVFAVGGAMFLILGNVLGLATAFVMFVSTVLPLIGMFSLLASIVGRFGKSVADNAFGIRDAFVHAGEAIRDLIGKLADSFGRFFDSVQPLVNVLEDLVDSGIKVLAEFIESLADAIDRLTPEQVDTIRDIVLAIAGFLALRVGLGLLGSVLLGLVTTLGGLFGIARGSSSILLLLTRLLNLTKAVAAISLIKTAIVGLTTALKGGVLVGAIRAIGLAITASLIPALIALATNPVVLAIVAIIAAIALAVAAYQTNFMGFKDFVDGVVAWISENVIPPLMGFIEAVAGFVSGVIEGIIGAVTWVVEAVEGVIDFFSNLPENIAAIWTSIVEGIQSFIDSVLTFIGDFLADLGENWAYYLGFILGFVVGWWINLWKFIITTIINIVTGVIGWIAKLPGMILDWLVVLWNLLAGWFGDLIEAVVGWVTDLVTGIVDWFLKLPGRVLDALVGLWNTISTWFITNVPKIIQFVADMIPKIVQFFIDLPGKIIDAVIGLPGLLRDFIVDIVPKIWQNLLNVGKDFVRGIWGGIISLKNWIIDKIMDFAGGFIDGIKAALGIASPSKVMAAVGVNVVQGLARGLLSADDARRAMATITSQLTDMAIAGTSDIALSPGAFSSSTTSSATRVIELKVTVESPDGSVSDVDLSSLKDLITGSDMVRALEHMSTVA